MSNKTQQTGQKKINADLMLSIAEIEKDIALSKDALYWMNMLKALGVEECEKLYNDYATLVKPLSITLQLAVVIRHYETIANMYLACNDTSQAKDYNDRAAEMRKIITEKAEKEVLEKAYSKLFDKLKDPQHNDSSILRDKFTALQSDDERDAWAAKRSQAEVNGLVKILDAYHNLHRVVISSNGFNESHRTKSQALIDEKISEDLKSAFARISKPFPSSKPKIVEITSQYYKPPTSSSDPLITDHVAQIDDTPKASVAAAATYSNDSSKEE